MSNPLDWNAKTIAEFRANQGRVGGNFAGAPMVLVQKRSPAKFLPIPHAGTAHQPCHQTPRRSPGVQRRRG
jgi:hypothetical protein